MLYTLENNVCPSKLIKRSVALNGILFHKKIQIQKYHRMIYSWKNQTRNMMIISEKQNM